MPPNSLRIIRARENNLKELSAEIPHDELVVLTGLSGSGKSSLAFDTVYAEGQRRYIETFSPYTRQFFDKVKKPDVDLIENVRPAIAIQQRTRVTGSRSSVGTMTNINDYLKVLWSNISTPICPTCGVELESWSGPELADHLIDLQRADRHEVLLIAAKAVLPESPAAKRNELDRLVTLGFSRIFDAATGEIRRIDDEEQPEFSAGDLIVVIDRLKSDTANRKRLGESIEQAFSLGSGICLVIDPHGAPEGSTAARFRSWEFRNFYGCGRCGAVVQKARSALFSFNHPIGACPECKGFGRVLQIDPKLCVPNPSLSIKEHALQCWAGKAGRGEFRKLIKFCQSNGISTAVPWRDLPTAVQHEIFMHRSRDFRGVFPWFKRLERKAYKMHVRVFLSRYREQVACPACHGSRLRPEASAYRVQGKTLPDLWNMPIAELCAWLTELSQSLRTAKKLPRQLGDLFTAILSRLRYLENLGVGYLTLDRQARTLSGGETQRVNLAAALGSELISTHFVLDEPSVGLHARDTERLIKAIRELHQRGNSVMVVEHDPECIAEADQIVELGPKAGQDGGTIIYQGAAEKWSGITLSLDTPSDQKFTAASDAHLQIRNATARNLKGFDLNIPLGRFVCLTGVSGSGKSSLVSEVLMNGYDAYKTGELAQAENSVEGFAQLEQVLLIDQAPLAKSPRANIATYSGMWDGVRDLLAQSDDAKTRALSKSSFSFNVDGGRCPACSGSGFIREDMQFLSDVFIPCEVCLGKRFLGPVLEVHYRGKNVDDLLHLSVDDCARFFHGHEKIRSAAETLSLLGLGHLTLGHPLSELSGGEAQRLKLVPFIEQSASGSSLLIFDEPTTGLHLHDVTRLIELFRLLRDKGHSVLCIEHNLYLIGASDWIIDLGPEGGVGGGSILLEGSPARFIKNPKSSLTAAYLKDFYRGGAKFGKSTERRVSRKKPENKSLRIVGAREHNLKDITVDIPLGQVVALTGISGSGKSSIAKDIIYAEGQRRYLDCLSPYARQFIKELKKPDIDSISGIQPTICVYQHTFQPSRLSTIATMAEIYNFLRLLYAKTATQYCPEHPEQAISPLAAKEMAEEIGAIKTKQIRILAPIIKLKKGYHKPIFERAIESEIFEVRVDGMFANPSRFEEGLERSKPHTIEYVIAKFNPAQMDPELIEEAVTQALSLGGGTIVAHADGADTVFSMERTCPQCKTGFYKPDPEDLSFNSKRGVCLNCEGTGREDDEACPECGGSRISEIGRNLRLNGKNIHEACNTSPSVLRAFLSSLKLDTKHTHLAAPILLELYAKIDTLIGFGLDYLHLDRDCSTLSGGELQRLRLATAIGSPLTGAMYIFDEPSVGLHPVDNAKVLARLHTLKDKGNSVIMIEHDIQSIAATDHLIEVGPGGGKNGGEIVNNAPIAEVLESPDSITARALAEPVKIASDKAATRPDGGTLTIQGGTRNNIRNLSLDIPLHAFVTVAGVSGAGKSSLVKGLIVETLTEGKNNKLTWSSPACTLKSSTAIDRVLTVDQRPIGINSRSTPASYLGVWDEIRKLFASSIEAKTRGWSASHFSYNTGNGRCGECKGQGEIKLEMNFLPDARVTCESCNGSRFLDETNSVHYLGLSVSDVLALTFDEARLVFAKHDKIHRPLHRACELGLGYLTLGQSSTTLSGGESQRIKLVSELSGKPKGHALYVLDEPTTGLHRADVARLLSTLGELVSRGNTVIVIEHDPDVIAAADHVIEMGPGPGDKGGEVIFQGTPAALVRGKTLWAAVLKDLTSAKIANTAARFRHAANLA